MDPLVWEEELPPLRSPVLVCAFDGWNDAANAATTAVDTVAMALRATLVGHIDPEEFFDFQANRPTIHLAEGESRHVEWPGNLLFVAQVPSAEHDLALLNGTEPSLRWRTFSEALAGFAEAIGAEMVVTLGALIADVPHTRPVPITGLASDRELVEELGLERSRYEGPTGIVGVLHDICARRGMRSASIWAAIPHYVAAVPNPKAALALLRRLEGLTGTAIDASELEVSMRRFDDQIDEAVASNPEIEELVHELEEEQRDEDERLRPGDVPSGDTIARDFQRFLRQRGE